jgi:hypothetical protein
MTKHALDIALVKKLWRYEPDTGLLYWTDAPEVYPSKRGKQAFTSVGNHRYGQTNYHGTVVLAHRIAWVLVHGHWPEQIDHINGVRTDNRLINLRNVNASENRRNAQKASNNKSGFNGVSWDRVNEKWVVRIKTLGGKYANLGRFESIQNAINTRISASEENGYHHNHGRAA